MRNIRDYWAGDKPPSVLTVIHEPDYRQLPPAEMLDAAATSVAGWSRDEVNMPPAFFPDFGTVTMAKPWGGRIERASEGEIYIHPAAATLDEALAIRPAENPDVELAAGMYRGLRERTGVRAMGFKSPDFQGVLNTAALVLRQDELMAAMYEQPDRLHRFLDVVCERNIAFMRELLERAGRVDGNIWPYVWVPQDVGVCVTEDMMPLLSPEQYRDFGIPYLRRIAEEFGGVFIHCCGAWGRHAGNLAASGVRILGMEFHHPFTRLEEIRPPLGDIVLVPYLAEFKTDEYEDFPSYLRDLLDRGDAGPLWIAATDSPEWRPDEVRQAVTSKGGAVEGFRE